MDRAFNAFKTDVESRAFPGLEHSTGIAEEEWQVLLEDLGEKGNG
jgi:hypothetical protein